MRTALAALAVLWAICGGLGGCLELPSIEGARCDAAHPCPEPFICRSERCRRLSGGPQCLTDEDCEGAYCEPEHLYCVQCLQDEHCFIGACIKSTCGCNANDQCPGRCNVDRGQCAPCLSDAQCDGDWCNKETGVCEKDRRYAPYH